MGVFCSQFLFWKSLAILCVSPGCSWAPAALRRTGTRIPRSRVPGHHHSFQDGSQGPGSPEASKSEPMKSITSAGPGRHTLPVTAVSRQLSSLAWQVPCAPTLVLSSSGNHGSDFHDRPHSPHLDRVFVTCLDLPCSFRQETKANTVYASPFTLVFKYDPKLILCKFYTL